MASRELLDALGRGNVVATPDGRIWELVSRPVAALGCPPDSLLALAVPVSEPQTIVLGPGTQVLS